VNKWHGNLDNKLWTRHCHGFIVEIKKAIAKKKTPEFFILRVILFADEAGFTGNCVFNVHNTHVWSDENGKMLFVLPVINNNFRLTFGQELFAII
jgi:hypothetical protein